MKKWLIIILFCIIVFLVVWFKQSSDIEFNANSSKDTTGYVTSTEKGKLILKITNIETGKVQQAYYQNSDIIKDMLVDNYSVSSYCILKEQNDAQTSLLFDYYKSKVYKINSGRVSILGETKKYLYLIDYADSSVGFYQYDKTDETIKLLSNKIEYNGEFIMTQATSNYSSDELYCCYLNSDKTYVCKVSDESLYIEELVNDTRTDTVCLNKDGSMYLSIYNTKSVPYIFEPVIIDKSTGENNIMEVTNVDSGDIEFSFIVDDLFYMGFRSGSKLLLYSWNKSDGFKIVEEFDNAANVSWTIKEDKLYIRYDSKVKHIK